jgi:hypothetical protein
MFPKYNLKETRRLLTTALNMNKSEVPLKHRAILFEEEKARQVSS